MGLRIGDDLTTTLGIAGRAGFPPPVPEHRFCPGRRFAFDYAWPGLMVALEREGGTWHAGRHSRGKGYESDCRKYSLAAVAGWRVVRVTVDMIESGEAATLLLAALEAATAKGTL